MRIQSGFRISKTDHDVGAPPWYNPRGWNIELDRLNSASDQVVLKSSAVELFVQREPSMHQATPWRVKWQITHSKKEHVEGVVFLATQDVREAFGLSGRAAGVIPPESSWLMERYGAEVAHQGRFIRRHRYLNIPGPGTGRDGDPNISIFLNDGIVAAVEHMLGAI